jgi:hypothetical protein
MNFENPKEAPAYSYYDGETAVTWRLIAVMPLGVALGAVVATMAGWVMAIAGIVVVLSIAYFVFLARRHRSSYSLQIKAATGYLVAALLAGIAANAFALTWAEVSEQLVLANILLCLAAYPLWRYLKRREFGIPFLPLLTLFYGILYGMPAFFDLEPQGPGEDFTDDSKIQALRLATAGLVMLLLGFYLSPINKVRALLPQLSVAWSERKAILLAFGLGILGITVNIIIELARNIPVEIAVVLNTCKALSLLAIAILFLLQMRSKLTSLEKSILWGGIIPLEILVDIGTGLLFPLFQVGIVLLLVYIVERKRLPWKLIVLGMPVLLALLVAKAEFRALTWDGNKSDIDVNPVEKGWLFIEIAQEFLTVGDPEQISFALEQAFFRRADALRVLAHIVEETPSNIPYWNGETYMHIFWKPIPRIIYPDKPLDHLGQAFGHRYSFLAPDDFESSTNFPFLVEMYANFGAVGVLLGMVMLGGLIRTLYFLMNHEAAGSWGIVAFAFVASNLMNIESNFSGVYGGLIYTIPMLYLLGRVVRENAKDSAYPSCSSIV